ncbi:MAG: hypothetical protein G01um101456_545 [Parcubacteria group bacterium Gr01-1014_56]|nr:MAG: hypothetical protein G01um101456_545 [Parcubacteria group bacterium Gr01-1014_56]
MASRALPVSKLKARRRRRLISIIVALCVLVVVLLGGVVGLSWLPAIRVHTVDIVGASSVKDSVLEEMVGDDLRGTYFGVLARDTIFFYPQSSIEEKLLAGFPAFSSVEIRRSGLQSLVVTITERSTTAFWCGESAASPSACFLLDGSGVAYAPAANFSGQVYVNYYGPLSGTNVKQFSTPEQFRAISALVVALQKTAGEAPLQVEVDDTDVQVTFKSGFKIIYRILDNSADVLERFSLAIKAEPFTKHALSDFEYLDLRFGDKLYYKLKVQP